VGVHGFNSGRHIRKLGFTFATVATTPVDVGYPPASVETPLDGMESPSVAAKEEEEDATSWSVIAEETGFRGSTKTPRHFHPAIKEFFLTYSAHTPADRVAKNIIHTCDLDIPVKDVLLPDGSNWKDSTKVVDTLLQTFCDCMTVNACPTVELSRMIFLIKSRKCLFHKDQPIYDADSLENVMRSFEKERIGESDLSMDLAFNLYHLHVDDTSRLPLDVYDSSIFGAQPFPSVYAKLPTCPASEPVSLIQPRASKLSSNKLDFRIFDHSRSVTISKK
jgi:hypothetical protein